MAAVHLQLPAKPQGIGACSALPIPASSPHLAHAVGQLVDHRCRVRRLRGAIQRLGSLHAEWGGGMREEGVSGFAAAPIA